MQCKANHRRREFMKVSATFVVGGTTLALLNPYLRLGEKVLTWFNPARETPLRMSSLCMGTYVDIALYGLSDRQGNQLLKESFAEFQTVERLMTTFNDRSDVSQVNRLSGREDAVVDPRLCDVVLASQRMGNLSGGIFDITVLPLMKAYGFRDGRPRFPAADELAGILPLVDYRQVRVDEKNHRVGLSKRGAQMDLGGIAKGYAVDRVAGMLRRQGVERAVINAGGNIYALGAPRDGVRWQIGVQHPLEPGRLAATLSLRDQAVATSGNYEHFLLDGDRRIGHLLDPRRGYLPDPMQSATIVASSAMQADALSTAAFLMGPEKAEDLLNAQAGVGGLFLTADGRDLRHHRTPGLRNLQVV